MPEWCQSQDPSLLRMRQGLLKEHQGPEAWGWRAGGASQSRDSLCWADGHSHHLWVLSLGHWDLAAIEGPPSLLATVPQPTAASPHATVRPCLRVCIQPDTGSTRWSVRMLLCFAFKANPHTSTHTATWPKFEKPFLQYHRWYVIIYHSAQRQQMSRGGEGQEQQQECRPLSIPDVPMNHRAHKNMWQSKQQDQVEGRKLYLGIIL